MFQCRSYAAVTADSLRCLIKRKLQSKHPRYSHAQLAEDTQRRRTTIKLFQLLGRLDDLPSSSVQAVRGLDRCVLVAGIDVGGLPRVDMNDCDADEEGGGIGELAIQHKYIRPGFEADAELTP